ncbi:MAG TPA: glycoside hydrolase family 3 C-terminal domain-containing protein [Bacteroidaceae bacterium]|jgi:beta-glucosidase|nr:glycoside hydrolase family 3 C-terminal domain-containing protein [Bacteroidaceae bacterium]MBP8602887.1 glycoside hydrolase family 3 C-terminal domain-containing protein [Bacteroidaceae bacterium]HPB03597.1 glycoside hydrolase family 3 C-terminal domain-containing protein [Bacteroidaceae bacterium]
MKKFCFLAGLAVVLSLTACGGGSSKYEYPFQNPKLKIEKRVDNLLSLLTPEEKVGLMMNGSISIDNLGIPAYNWWSEACHGICTNGATVFPQAIALAATWDDAQQYEVYTAVSDEARAHWNITDHNQFGKTRATGGAWHQGLSFWCPNINIFRDPRWGRGQETSGEDPYLSGKMGTALVKGMQGDNPKYYKTHACAKHYAVHSGLEADRHRFDVSVSMRDLWETYLPVFKTLVTEANVQEVMCAYNRYEGEPCCGSRRLLTEILRDKWGFKGLVVSDCGAIGNFYNRGQHETHPNALEASVDAVLSGTDIECGTSYNALVQAMQEGKINEADLDVSLRRILRSRFELGMHDPAEMDPWKDLGADVLSCPEHTALAHKAANESMVLLKNDNNILPLKKESITIAIVGPNADNVTMQYGNYNGTPIRENQISILQAIRAKVPNANIIYDRACELADEYLTVSHIQNLNGGQGIYAEFFNNVNMSGTPVAKGYYNEVNMRTMGDYRFAEGVEFNNFSARMTGKFVADFTGDLSYNLRGNDTWKLTVNGRVIAEQKEAAQQGAGGMRRGTQPQAPSFRVVKGQTYNIQLDYTKGATGSAYLTFDLSQRKLAEFGSVAQKVKDADVIIMVCGISARLEGEEMRVNYEGFSGGDRTRIELPKVQLNLLEAMYKTGKPVILVNCSGSAIGFGAVENQYQALLQAWYGGQAGGLAVADVLFGDYNPAGRLPVTFYKSTDQLPDVEDYNMDSGFTYRYFKGEPLYAFGYGLSYTTFAYGDATLSKKSIKAGGTVDITVPVTNSGNRDGDEVVQIYIKSLDNPDAPIKALKGFKRVNIPAGQTAQVKITLEPKAFEYYDGRIDELAAMPGRYKILYGPSSLDKDLKSLDFTVK